MKSTGWWLLQWCLGQFLKIYLITHVLHGSWRNCEPKGTCLFSACIICTYSCCFSGVNVSANWHVSVEWKRLYKTPPHMISVTNSTGPLTFENYLKYIYVSAPYWCNGWPVTDHNPPWCLWLYYHTTVWSYITAGARLYKMIWLINIVA